MKTIILAGGKATRLYPITLYVPKQLIMLNGYPMIHYVIKHCKSNGIKNMVLCISDTHKSDFVNALGDGKYMKTNIEYSVAPEHYGTAGRILHAKKLIGNDDDFIVYYGDMITNFNLKSMIKFHNSMSSDESHICTLAMSGSRKCDFGGGFEIKGTHKIIKFTEKPKVSEISNFKVNTGIGIFKRKILQYCQKKGDLNGDVLPRAIKNGKSVYCFTIKEPFYDIGTFAVIDTLLKEIRRQK